MNISTLSVFPSAYSKLSSIMIETTSLIHNDVNNRNTYFQGFLYLFENKKWTAVNG
jgi:hypothetical protein